VYAVNKDNDQAASHSSLHSHVPSDDQSRPPSVDYSHTRKDDFSHTPKDDHSCTPKSHTPTDRLSPISKDDQIHPIDDQNCTPQDTQSDISSTAPSLTSVTSQHSMAEHQSPGDGQQQLLPEHLTAASPGDSVTEELESSGDEDTMFEETTHSPISKWHLHVYVVSVYVWNMWVTVYSNLIPEPLLEVAFTVPCSDYICWSLIVHVCMLTQT